MNRALSRITLALTLGGSLIGALMSPALADGDPYYSNGINASGVRTPIPAPIPVPVDEAFWYLRADFAAGFGTNPSVAVLGTNYADLIAGAVQSDSFEPSFTGGGGIGYVWSAYFRTDITVDVHSLMNTEFTGSAALRSIVDRQDEVHVDHPARQRLLRHSHRHGLVALPRPRRRLCRQPGDAQPLLFRHGQRRLSPRPATGRPTCSSPAPPWSA